MPASLPPFVIRGLKIAAYLLPVALIVHAVRFWRRGIIDIEAMQFVLNYLQKRPFFAQIFDPQINDWGWYQAREFSYLFDFIDARVFAALLDRHILLFAPLSGTVGLIVFSAAFVCGARRVLRLEHVTISLALSLFLSCIVIQASTAIFYRSSKIILSIILLGFLFSLVSLMHEADANSPIKLPKLVTFYFSGALMSMCDRQGFFYLGAGTAIVSILWLLRIIQRRPAWPNHFYIILAALGAIVTATLYNHVLAPWVIYLLNGYWPRFDFQHLTKAQLINPGLVAPAWQMFREQVRFFFGNIPFAALCIISAIALLAKMGKSLFRIPIVARFKQILKDDLAITTVASVVAINLLLLVMIARHPPVYSVPDHSFWYYPFTVHVILLFGISGWLSRPDVGNDWRWKSALWLLFLVCIALNIGGYPKQRQIMIDSSYFQQQWKHSQFLAARYALSEGSQNASMQPAEPDSWRTDFSQAEVNFLDDVRAKYAALKQPGR